MFLDKLPGCAVMDFFKNLVKIAEIIKSAKVADIENVCFSLQQKRCSIINAFHIDKRGGRKFKVLLKSPIEVCL